MQNFLDELNSISRTKKDVEEAQKKERIKKLHDNMTLDKALLDEFDERLIKNIKSIIKNRAYMGEYSIRENNRKRIEGRFHLVKKYVDEYIGVNQFNGIKFDNQKRRIEVPFEANLIVFEPTQYKKSHLINKQGYRIYANHIIKNHIIKTLSKEGITIYKIENMPIDMDFVTIKDFKNNYINRTITFYYYIEY